MAKVIRLKMKDINKIVKNVLKESEEFDDFDTKIQPEELPDSKYADDMDNEDLFNGNYTTTVPEPNNKDIMITKDAQTGQIVILRPGTGEILGQK